MPIAAGNDFFSLDQKLFPVRIVLVYSLVGLAWILCSDSVTAWFVSDVTLFEQIAMGKGVAFILFTSTMLYLLIRFYVRQIRDSQVSSSNAEQEIKKLAYYDRDTGLPNQNMLMDRLNQIIAFNSRKLKNTAVHPVVWPTALDFLNRTSRSTRSNNPRSV
ncbi:MAG: hypothetical protein WCP10_14820 [Desulfuromonadales bacterium]